MTLEQLQKELNEDVPGISVPLFFPDSSKTAKDILPKPASVSRKEYDSNPFTVKPLVNIRDVYIKDEELYKRLDVEWGAIGPSSEITHQHMEWFAKDQLKYANKTELKYIDIVSATTKEIVYRFAVERWLYDNFNTATPIYKPTTRLIFPLKIDLPQFFSDNTERLAKIITQRFDGFMKSRKSKLMNSNFSFLKRTEVDMFDFAFDIHYGTKGAIIAALRSSIIIGALAIYSTRFFGKKLTKSQESSVYKSASRFSDVDNLNRFLKGIK